MLSIGVANDYVIVLDLLALMNHDNLILDVCSVLLLKHTLYANVHTPGSLPMRSEDRTAQQENSWGGQNMGALAIRLRVRSLLINAMQ